MPQHSKPGRINIARYQGYTVSYVAKKHGITLEEARAAMRHVRIERRNRKQSEKRKAKKRSMLRERQQTPNSG